MYEKKNSTIKTKVIFEFIVTRYFEQYPHDLKKLNSLVKNVIKVT